MDARKLRMWHWRRAMSARKTANHHLERAREWERQFTGKAVYNRHRADEQNRLADFHIGCVQVLNDHPDCLKAKTTAEQDCEKEKRKCSLIS